MSAERRRPRGKAFRPKQISRTVMDVVHIDERGCRSSAEKHVGVQDDMPKSGRL